MKFFENATTVRARETQDIIADLFREFHAVPEYEPNRTISPSSLNCQVACAFKLTGKPITPQKESFQTRSYAEAGEDRHKRIQAFLSQTEYWVDIEQYIKEKQLPLEIEAKDGFEYLIYSQDLRVRFKCDGLLLVNGQYHILEIKTERQSANSSRIGPEDKHQKQAMAYCLLLDIDKVLWLYEGRDFLEQKVYLQLVSREERKQIAKYIGEILRFQHIPEKLQKDEKACNYCNYRNYCKMFFRKLKLEEHRKNAG